MSAPWFWIIGGPNGAGKTTFSLSYLGTIGVKNFVNADLIAAGLSPFKPEAEPILSGKLMLQKVSEHIKRRENVAIETTLAGETFAKIARTLKTQGWRIGVIYLWLETVAIALRRVEERAKKGGHRIPPKTVIRRHARGLAKLKNYLELADSWLIFDNSYQDIKLVATGDSNGVMVEIPDIYDRICHEN